MSGKFKGIMLVSDMDGTLLNSRHMISPENLEAIEYFIEKGGIFTIATGRMEQAVEPYLKQLHINAPAILYNGSVIYDFNKGQIIRENTLDDSTDAVIEELGGEFKGIGIEIFHAGNMYITHHNEETYKHCIRENLVPVCASVRNIPKPWHKAIAAWQHEKLEQVELFLKSRLKGFYTVYSEPWFLELIPLNTSKGTALKELSTMMNISIDNTFAVGDNLNDLDMIKTAGIGIAVRNANDIVKENADYISLSNDNNALEDVIKVIDKKTKVLNTIS